MTVEPGQARRTAQGRKTMDDGRLDRIEAKIDKLADAVVSMARMEERMITLFKRTDENDREIKDIINRIGALERVSYGRGFFFRWTERFLVLIVGALVAAGARFLGGVE